MTPCFPKLALELMALMEELGFKLKEKQTTGMTSWRHLELV
jgi:hypothetical protein